MWRDCCLPLHYFQFYNYIQEFFVCSKAKKIKKIPENCSDLLWEKKLRITRTIYWNSERSEQFLKQIGLELLKSKLEQITGCKNLQEQVIISFIVFFSLNTWVWFLICNNGAIFLCIAGQQRGALIKQRRLKKIGSLCKCSFIIFECIVKFVLIRSILYALFIIYFLGLQRNID